MPKIMFFENDHWGDWLRLCVFMFIRLCRPYVTWERGWEDAGDSSACKWHTGHWGLNRFSKHAVWAHIFNTHHSSQRYTQAHHTLSTHTESVTGCQELFWNRKFQSLAMTGWITFKVIVKHSPTQWPQWCWTHTFYSTILLLQDIWTASNQLSSHCLSVFWDSYMYIDGNTMWLICLYFILIFMKCLSGLCSGPKVCVTQSQVTDESISRWF